MKIPIKTILILLSAIIIIVAGYFIFFDESEEIGSESAVKNVDYEKLDEIIFDVKTAKVIRGELIKSTNANGLIRAAQEIEVVSNVSGYISSINIFEGKKVNKGDLLIQLDDREYQIALKEADDQLVEARVEYGFLAKDTAIDSVDENKAKIISKEIAALDEEYKNGVIPESQYLAKRDDLEIKLIFTGAKKEELILNKSGFSRAVNAKERAKLNLAYTKITAPFNGVIGDFDLTKGQRINGGEKLFKLFDLSKLRIDVGVLESEITNISKGNRVEITVNALPGKTFKGIVTFVSPYIDKVSKTCKVTIEISGHESSLKPGMFATVKIETATLKDRVLIPKEALLVRDRRNLVFAAEDTLAKWKYVDIGEQNDQYIEILNGVSPGEDVIIEGHYTLAHDARIEVINK